MSEFQGNTSNDTIIANEAFNDTYFLNTTHLPSNHESFTPPPFCTEAGETYCIFYLIIFEICALSITPLTRMYIVNPLDVNGTGSRASNRKHTKTQQKIQRWTPIIFAFVTFVYLGLMAPVPYLMCIVTDPVRRIQVFRIHRPLGHIYVIQYMLLIFLYFYRVYLSFKNTPFKLSNRLLWYYGILWTLLCSVGIMITIMMEITDFTSDDWERVVIFMKSQYYLLGILTISTTVTFIYKLIQVIKMDSNSDDNGKLIGLMTKTSLLTIISMLSTILGFIFASVDFGYATMSYEDMEIFRNISFTATIVDVYSNFICYMLTYNSAQKYYLGACGFCDTRCQALCKWIVTREMISGASKDEDVKYDTDEITGAIQRNVCVK